MPQALGSLLATALAQPLYTSTDALEEAHENLFYFELAEAELPLYTAPSIETWVAAAVTGKRQQLLHQRPDGYAMQFYCWHDAQASQLRFSLVSAAAALPFRSQLQLVELAIVVREFLRQEYLLFGKNIVESDTPAAELAAEQAATQEFILPVWRTVIP